MNGSSIRLYFNGDADSAVSVVVIYRNNRGCLEVFEFFNQIPRLLADGSQSLTVRPSLEYRGIFVKFLDLSWEGQKQVVTHQRLHPADAPVSGLCQPQGLEFGRNKATLLAPSSDRHGRRRRWLQCRRRGGSKMNDLRSISHRPSF